MPQPPEPPIFNGHEPLMPGTVPVRPRFKDSAVVQSKLAVLAVLFFVTGFLGLPLLWLCKNFSTAERWFWAIANTIYTCALIWIVFKICMWSWNRISQSFY